MLIVGCIPQRMGSGRFPGKALCELAGRPLTYNFIERCKRSNLIRKFVMAVPDLPENDVFEEIARKTFIDFYRYQGDQGDVLGRIYHAVKDYKPDVVVRLIIDNPMIEPGEIDRIIMAYLKGRMEDCLYSNTHNIYNNGYPDGLGAEVYPFELIEWLHGNITNPHQREHPHSYCYENYRVETILCPTELAGYSDIKLDINTEEEYRYIKSIYDLFSHNEFHATDYLPLLKKKEEADIDNMGIRHITY